MNSLARQTRRRPTEARSAATTATETETRSSRQATGRSGQKEPQNSGRRYRHLRHWHLKTFATWRSTFFSPGNGASFLSTPQSSSAARFTRRRFRIFDFGSGRREAANVVCHWLSFGALLRLQTGLNSASKRPRPSWRTTAAPSTSRMTRQLQRLSWRLAQIFGCLNASMTPSHGINLIQIIFNIAETGCAT
jgi:hypothetical protein